MGPVFADTFYWVALTNVKDAAHEQAKTFSRSSSLSSIVTTELVLDRVSELLRRLGFGVSTRIWPG